MSRILLRLWIIRHNCVDELTDLVKEISERRVRAERRRKLLELISKIESGEIDSSEVPLDQLFSLWNGNGRGRGQYISPLDRSSYNYGYMIDGEVVL